MLRVVKSDKEYVLSVTGLPGDPPQYQLLDYGPTWALVEFDVDSGAEVGRVLFWASFAEIFWLALRRELATREQKREAKKAQAAGELPPRRIWDEVRRTQIDSLIELGFAERGPDGEARPTELGKDVWFEISDTAGAPDVPPRAGSEPDAGTL